MDKNELLQIFQKDFEKVVKIYNRVSFISKITPLKISYKYPTDQESLVLINLSDIQYQKIKIRHEKKIQIELTSIKNNLIPTMIKSIKEILSR